MNGIEFMVRDMLAQGPIVRQASTIIPGIRIPPPRRSGCRLTGEQITFILDMKGCIPIRELQTMMQVSRGAISNIWTGRDARAAKILKKLEAS